MNRIQIKQEDTKLSIDNLFVKTNTLYELSGEIDLKEATVIVPEGCVLQFGEGARITNGTLVLSETLLTGAKHCIATEVGGVQEELDTDYFDLTLANKTSVMQSIVDTARIVQLHGCLENVFDNIQIGGKEISLIGNGATIVNTSVRASAITITDNNFIRIVDLDFNISSGYAIYKNVSPTTTTYLSFMIDRCRFVSTGSSSTAIIQLLGSREGNITNCFFEGSGKTGCIGINRQNAVNTNVIGCMFSNLSYGIKAIGVKTSLDSSSELYSKFSCGLNVQSAVMLGCKYGIYIEGNDSFFLNNSMIDYCDNPLVLMSQDGANITNNYFSTSTTYNDYSATITIRNNSSKGAANRNKRIIISGNTIYGHRTTNNYGIEMDVASKDCTIQSNTIDFCIGYDIYLMNADGWSTEKLLIDNNRLYFISNGSVGIGSNTYSGSEQIVLSSNCAYAQNYTNCKLVEAGSSVHGTYIYHNNKIRSSASAPTSGDNEPQFFWGKQKSTTRFKFNLTFAASATEMYITNPLGDAQIVVYVGNNKAAICVKSVDASKIYFTKSSTSAAVPFIAVIELMNNI